MLHKVKGRKLNRTANERKRLFRNLTRSLILHGQINTTLAKAKAIQPFTEKLVTKAKNNSLRSRRLLLKELADEVVVNKLLSEIGPLFINRSGGYTRIIKTENHLGDNSIGVMIGFTENVSNSSFKEVKPKEKKEIDKKIKKGKENAKDKSNKK